MRGWPQPWGIRTWHDVVRMDCICPQGPLAKLDMGRDANSNPQMVGRNMTMLLVAK